MGRRAIPVYVEGTEPVNVGSAFLARRRGEIGIITAAHVPIKAHPYATPDWPGWPAKLNFVLPSRDALPAQLFLTLGQSKVPLFKHHIGDPATGRLSDMIGLFGAAYAELVTALSVHYPIFDIPTSFSLSIDDTVSCHGYPGAAPDGSWPPDEETAAGPVCGFRGLIVEAEMHVAEGFSGGPVTTADGTLAGMVIGRSDDDARAQIVSAGALGML